VISSKAKKIVLIALLAVSFIGLFPIAARLGDPLFTYPFRTGWQYEYPVLLVWPDHIEMHWFHDISEVSPRPANAPYTFNVAPERQAWVENKVRSTPAPNGADAGWIIHVKQFGLSRQQIQLELMGDGIIGLVYEVRGDEIVPLRSRLAGPLSSFSILFVLLLLWGGFWLLVWLVSHLVKRQHRQRLAVLDA
jgi:hypothetical protein